MAEKHKQYSFPLAIPNPESISVKHCFSDYNTNFDPSLSMPEQSVLFAHAPPELPCIPSHSP